MGYHRAGFTVTGVDIEWQPHYPFGFVLADALEYLVEHGHRYDAIHASPPCQDHSSLRSVSGDHGSGHLLDATRAALVSSGRPWIMENVPGAPMPAAVMLCGSMFGLGAMCRDGVWRQLRRHRLFEHHPDVPAWPPYTCDHRGQPVGVYGNGGSGGPMADRRPRRGYQAIRSEAATALGVDWMSKAGQSQAIPPAYTEHLGAQLLAHMLAG